MKVLVTGAGGFLGGHLVRRLLDDGHRVRAVSRRPAHSWTQRFDGEDVERVQADLRGRNQCAYVVKGMDAVYNLASRIGGLGFLEKNHALCSRSVVINANLLEAAVTEGCKRYLFPSSACVYPDTGNALARPIRESDAYPPNPPSGYGWEKLYSERMCLYHAAEYGLQVRIPRLHTVYGPHSPIGEHEKAPIALCRKVVQAIRAGRNELEIWGDGEQTRSFLYVDDAIDALVRLMDSECGEPINIGSAVRVTVNQLADAVEAIAGVKLQRQYRLDMPQGVRGRVSDNARAGFWLGWKESTSLLQGLEKTYRWVEQALPRQALAA